MASNGVCVCIHVCVYKMPKNVIVKLLKTKDRENLENMIVCVCIKCQAS